MAEFLEKRRLGRTGQYSTVVIYGAASLGEVTQEEADQSIDYAMKAGINHFDTAASYGNSELRLGKWMPEIRKDIFLSTKTEVRSREESKPQIEQSLKRLQTDHVDLIQIHGVTTFEELDKITAKGGALEAAIEAKEQGMARFIGITGHGHISPAIHLEALKRFPFDTVLTPLNFILYSNEEYRKIFTELAAEVKRQDVGLMAIKAVARGPWKTEAVKKYATWYEPFDEQTYIDRCVSFDLSFSSVTGLPSAGDVRLLPSIVDAAKRYKPLSEEEMTEMMKSAAQFGSPFGPLVTGQV